MGTHTEANKVMKAKSGSKPYTKGQGKDTRLQGIWLIVHSYNNELFSVVPKC